MELDVVLGACSTIRKYRPVIWAENEPFFKRRPPDTRFVDTMRAEFGYRCQSVAELEQLCPPPERHEAVFKVMDRIMRHLNVPVTSVNLQHVLTENEPEFAQIL